MTVTVTRSQPKPVVENVVLTLSHYEARVLKLVATYRESVGGVLAGVLSIEAGSPALEGERIREVLKVLGQALSAEDITWNIR